MTLGWTDLTADHSSLLRLCALTQTAAETSLLGLVRKNRPPTLSRCPFTSSIPTPPLANTDLTSASTGCLFWRLHTARGPGDWLLSPSTTRPGLSYAEEESALHFFLLQPKERTTCIFLFSSHTSACGSSLPRDQARALWSGSPEPRPLDHRTTGSFYVPVFIYLSSLAGQPPLLDYCESCCCEHSCASFCLNICF